MWGTTDAKPHAKGERSNTSSSACLKSKGCGVPGSSTLISQRMRALWNAIETLLTCVGDLAEVIERLRYSVKRGCTRQSDNTSTSALDINR